MSKFDQPASVWWSTAEPSPMSDTRQFWTLSDAIRYVQILPNEGRLRVTVRCAGSSYGPAEFKQLETEMRQQRPG